LKVVAAWDAELESNGRVVFPPRRGRLSIRLAGFGLLMVLSAWTNFDHLRADGLSGGLAVLRLTALAAFVYGTGLTLWQLITSRPSVTIDESGITRGRTLNWSTIAGIDDPTGFPGARTIQIRPTNRRTRPITIPQDNVPNLPELATWLRTLHTQHRPPN
jgi:hypothetical protein